MGLFCVDFHMATSVLWSSSNDSTCDILLTTHIVGTHGHSTVYCIYPQIGREIAGVSINVFLRGRVLIFVNQTRVRSMFFEFL